MMVQKYLTVTACYRYAGAEIGWEYWSGNDIRDSASTDANTARCSDLCPGNRQEYCDKGGRLLIYETSETTLSISQACDVSEMAVIGCLIDEADPYILDRASTSAEDMTLEKVGRVLYQL